MEIYHLLIILDKIWLRENRDINNPQGFRTWMSQLLHNVTKSIKAFFLRGELLEGK